jgi:hypothetical protein
MEEDFGKAKKMVLEGGVEPLQPADKAQLIDFARLHNR